MLNNYDNIVFVANTGDDTISIISLSNMLELYKIRLANGSGPHHIAVDSNQNYLYTTNSHNGSIGVVDLIRNLWVDNIYVGSHPSHLEINKKNRCIYVSNADSNSISIVDMDSRVLSAQVSVDRIDRKSVV